nr:unnamed protein product [Callosobruchus chinensis]
MTPKATDEDMVMDKVAQSLGAITAQLSKPPSSSLSANGLSEASRNFADYVAAKLERITDEELARQLDVARSDAFGCVATARRKAEVEVEADSPQAPEVSECYRWSLGYSEVARAPDSVAGAAEAGQVAQDWAPEMVDPVDKISSHELIRYINYISSKKLKM